MDSGLDNAEAELDAASGALTTWDEARHRVEEARLALEAQERRVEEARAQEQAAVEAEASSWEEWQQWLGQRRLDEGLTPETLVEFTGRIETARAEMRSVRQMRQRVSAIGVDIEEYHQLVRPLADRCPGSLQSRSTMRKGDPSTPLRCALSAARSGWRAGLKPTLRFAAPEPGV